MHEAPKGSTRRRATVLGVFVAGIVALASLAATAMGVLLPRRSASRSSPNPQMTGHRIADPLALHGEDGDQGEVHDPRRGQAA